ncbi:poly(3-hydroxyalkanoic acid) synthase 2 [Methylorubrum populi]|uniref:Poly(3-hydroxyalkanoic acid) synthase 2 n=1 Tax=Methylorubrum populi TaxID=223967 RepID=A0A160PCI8_9HYPH|nr:poly(3-hydroxyalkanoic acid) synthase 2 [Methylorubrum populi]
MTLVELHAVARVRQDLDDQAVELHQFLFRHAPVSGRAACTGRSGKSKIGLSCETRGAAGPIRSGREASAMPGVGRLSRNSRIGESPLRPDKRHDGRFAKGTKPAT